MVDVNIERLREIARHRGLEAEGSAQEVRARIAVATPSLEVAKVPKDKVPPSFGRYYDAGGGVEACVMCDVQGECLGVFARMVGEAVDSGQPPGTVAAVAGVTPESVAEALSVWQTVKGAAPAPAAPPSEAPAAAPETTEAAPTDKPKRTRKKAVPKAKASESAPGLQNPTPGKVCGTCGGEGKKDGKPCTACEEAGRPVEGVVAEAPPDPPAAPTPTPSPVPPPTPSPAPPPTPPPAAAPEAPVFHLTLPKSSVQRLRSLLADGWDLETALFRVGVQIVDFSTPPQGDTPDPFLSGQSTIARPETAAAVAAAVAQVDAGMVPGPTSPPFLGSCPVPGCGQPTYLTPSGVTCSNAHGGVVAPPAMASGLDGSGPIPAGPLGGFPDPAPSYGYGPPPMEDDDVPF